MGDKNWARKYPEKHAAKAKRWRDANPERAREMVRRWVEENPEQNRRIQRESAARRRARLFQDFLDAYGRECTCCGESNERFLTIEHIGGLQGRQRTNPTSEIVRLREAGWPDDVTIFCFNCNLGAQRNGGDCPHLAEVIELEQGRDSA